MMTNIISFIFGLLLVAVIGYSGYYTVNHSSFVIWFGVVTALVAPLAFEFLLTPFRSKDKQVIKNLSKVSLIEQLLQEAKDNETKVKLLEEQKQNLDKLISYESKRRTLLAERELYISQGTRALNEIKKINASLESLTYTKESLPDHLKELANAIEKIESTDLVFTINGKTYTIKEKYFEWTPFYIKPIFDLAKRAKGTLK